MLSCFILTNVLSKTINAHKFSDINGNEQKCNTQSGIISQFIYLFCLRSLKFYMNPETLFAFGLKNYSRRFNCT